MPITAPAAPCRVEPLEPRRLMSAAPPRPDHVVVVVEENRSQTQIIGSSDAPYLNALAAQGASFTDYRAVMHPSQPNYFAMFSGSTQGLTSDTVPTTRFTAPSLGGQLTRAGLSFRGFSEDLPYTGFTRTSRGYYARRHSPWISFTDVSWRANQPLRYFPRPGHYDELPTVSFVIPNLMNDMHDGTVRQGDDWLRQKLDPYVQWAKTHNSLLVVTWDEDDHHADNRIPTIIVGDGVNPVVSSTPYTHYSLLRTLEDMYGLPRLGEAAGASAITDVWLTPGPAQRLAPAADAYVFDASPRSNYGTAPTLDVKTRTDSAGASRDAYLKFDIGALSADSIGSVKLRFRARLSSTGTVATSIFSVADTAWTETGLIWDNRPALGGSLGTATVAATQSFWYEVDVTDYVRAQRAAGRRLITLAFHNPQNSSPKIIIDSRETGSGPTLVASAA